MALFRESLFRYCCFVRRYYCFVRPVVSPLLLFRQHCRLVIPLPLLLFRQHCSLVVPACCLAGTAIPLLVSTLVSAITAVTSALQSRIPSPHHCCCLVSIVVSLSPIIFCFTSIVVSVLCPHHCRLVSPPSHCCHDSTPPEQYCCEQVLLPFSPCFAVLPFCSSAVPSPKFRRSCCHVSTES